MQPGITRIERVLTDNGSCYRSEIGGAAGVASVSTVLVARSGLDGFHAAFTVIGVLALLGVVVAATGFARSAVREGEMS